MQTHSSLYPEPPRPIAHTDMNTCPVCCVDREMVNGLPLRLKKTRKEGQSKYINVKVVNNSNGTLGYQAFYTDIDGYKKSIRTFIDEKEAAMAAARKWLEVKAEGQEDARDGRRGEHP